MCPEQAEAVRPRVGEALFRWLPGTRRWQEGKVTTVPRVAPGCVATVTARYGLVEGGTVAACYTVGELRRLNGKLVVGRGAASAAKQEVPS
jgi:hypothetical protein